MASDAGADYDAQDTAEAFDEDNQLPDSDRMKGGDDGLTFEGMPDLLDVTYARGDNDVDGDDDALDADEEDDELLDSLGETGEDEDSLDDDDDVDALDDDDLTGETDDVDFETDLDALDGVSAHSAGEVELTDLDSLSIGDLAGAAGSAADYETTEELSDEDLMELDYKDPTGHTRGGPDDDVDRTAGEPAARSHENQSRVDEAPDSLPHPSHPSHPDREDERLEEALEETFPASDPVSAKHIT